MWADVHVGSRRVYGKDVYDPPVEVHKSAWTSVLAQQAS